MELVYLWVEKYKNIENQGFNFSPRFTCEYEDGELDIIDKEKTKEPYLKNFFGKNVNVTAIVGENGSGKSSLTDLILDLDGWISTDKQLLFVVNDGEDLKCHTLNFSDGINSSIKQEKINRERGRENGTISSNGLKFSFLSLSPFLPKLDSYYANSINLYSIFNYRATYESREFHYNSFMQSILADIPQLVEHEFINTFFNFKTKPKYFVFKYNKDIETIFKQEIEEILSSSSVKTETDKTCIRQIDIHSDIFASLIELNKKVEDKKEKLKNELNKLNNSKKKKKIINFQKNELFDKVNLVSDIKENRNNQEVKKINEELENIGSIDFFLSFGESSNDEFHFSTGELVMLYYIRALLEVNKKEYNSVLIIDECELFLHPAWQKKFIYLLNKIFNNHEHKRQIIISSHSPFILSDLPKENVIFLENGKQVDVNLNPFGANIHTLLSHGFFMKDGLMGEFAKEKINKAITHLNQKTLTEKEIDYCENIISIIGEPILKNQLQRMLDSKRLTKIDGIDKKIKDMEYELSVLKKYQKKATNDELNDKAKRKYTKKKKDDKSK